MKPQRLFCILLIIWMIADLLQAVFTPIHADEAYYALYGRHLDWGYYDHPPMVALLTAFSSILFHNNLGVRFATVILHCGTLLLTWKSLPGKERSSRDVCVFFIVASSLIMFSVYGFITTPDAPLLFFTALFFFLYRKYTDNPSWPVAVAMGVALSAMLYSKYMAVLVIGFVLLSNLKLLRDKRVWTAVLVAAILFVPHILWQVHNGFPSFQYHLIGRNSGFNIKYLLEYLPNQLLVYNPASLCLAIWFCWKNRKSGNTYERAAIFTLTGFIVFFWLMTLKGHAEPHWTVAASIPMITILWQELRKDENRKWLAYGVTPFVFLILIVRVAAPFMLSRGLSNEFGEKHAYDVIHEYCEGKPAVFVGSFQAPSLYSFYTGDKSMQISSLYNRKTQFDLWQFDRNLQGKPACIISYSPHKYKNRKKEGFELVKTQRIEFYIHKTESFQGTNRIQVIVDNYSVADNSLHLDMTLLNPYDEDFHFGNQEFPVTVHTVFLKDNKSFPVTCPLPADLVIPAGGSLKCTTTVRYIPDAQVVICLDNVINRSVNSKPFKIKIHD